MFGRAKQLIQQNKLVQLGLVFIIGIAVGTIFYPTKSIEEKLTQKHQEEIIRIKEQSSKELAVEQTKTTQVSQQLSSYKQETETKLSKLTIENTSLKKHQKTSYFKIVRPDGTIEIRKFSESESEASAQITTQIQQEFKQKIESIEMKWSKIHEDRVTKITKDYASKEQEYKKTIDELQKSKITKINEKHLGIEAGFLSNSNYYGHATYDVFGPIFIGIQAETGKSSTIGGGIGVKF